MRIRTLVAASLPLFFALALAATPALAGSDSDSNSGKSMKVKKFKKVKNDGPGQAVPEPGALLVFGAGAAGVAWTVRRRRNR